MVQTTTSINSEDNLHPPSTKHLLQTSSQDSLPFSNEIPTVATTNRKPTHQTLLFTRTILWSDLTITCPTNPSIHYHASTHEWNLTLPDIQLYASSSSHPSNPKQTLLAAAHFRFSRHARLGFLTTPSPSHNAAGLQSLNGKDAHDGDVQWEWCRNTSTKWVGYWRYDFAVPNGGGGSGPPRRFRLLRTRREEDGVVGWLGWASFRNYRLLDRDSCSGESGQEGEGKEVGVFLSDDLRSLTKVGELRLYEELEEGVLRGVVLALAVVSEKATRRCRRRGGGAGGSGDGGS